jgi:ribonuclease HI
MVYYAVSNGKSIGIFTNWNDCKESVNGYPNALYKKFDTKQEAEDFIALSNNKETKNVKQNKITDFLEKTTKINELSSTDFIPEYYVYTDGACSNNGRDNASAGIGVFFGTDDPRNLSKKLEGKQTNNTAELTAIIQAYYIIEHDLNNGKKIAILTDSEYSIKCLSGYGEKCYKQGWNKDIPNKELVKLVYETYKDKTNVKFIHVKAHTDNTDIHSLGNQHADRLANQAIGLDICPYNQEISTKIYLDVPFIKKDEVKKKGGIWDSTNKKWFVRSDNKYKDELITMFSS